MPIAKNKVIAGDYEGKDVVALLGEISIPVGPAGSLVLSLDNVESYEMHTDEADGAISAGNKCVKHITIQFRDGKKSLLEVDRDLCNVLIKNARAEAAARCGVAPEMIKSCDPHNEKVCRVCPCYRCTLWPKCCYMRIYDRRAKRRMNDKPA